jgi:hypothetical protein
LAIARRAAPTTAKPASCLKKFKAAKEAESLPQVAAALPLVTMALPPANTMNAKDFLHAVVHAADRDSSIVAIAAFNGYDRCTEFGLQEYNARAMAHLKLRPVSALPKPYTRGATKSILGYVSSLSNDMRREILDNLNRQRVLGEDIAEAMVAADTTDQAATNALSSEEYQVLSAQLDAHEAMVVALKGELATLRDNLELLLSASPLTWTEGTQAFVNASN